MQLLCKARLPVDQNPPPSASRADAAAPNGVYWYLGAPGATVYQYSRADAYTGHPVYVLKYRLPAGLQCDNCVLQW
jgi:hypothetical protein